MNKVSWCSYVSGHKNNENEINVIGASILKDLNSLSQYILVLSDVINFINSPILKTTFFIYKGRQLVNKVHAY